MTSKQVTDAFSLFDIDVPAAKKEMLEALGDIRGFEVWGDQVLLGVFVRPARTKGKIIYGGVAKEDIWQGKVGLILAIGPDAFTEADKTFNGRKPEVGDWAWHNVNEITCQHFLAGPGFIKHTYKVDKDGRLDPDGVREEDVRDWTGWPVRVVAGRNIYGRVDNPGILL